jgi:hypothetical protein
MNVLHFYDEVTIFKLVGSFGGQALPFTPCDKTLSKKYPSVKRVLKEASLILRFIQKITI